MDRVSKLKVETRKCGSKAVVISAQGVLDAHTSPQLEKKISNIFNKGIFWVVIDLGGVKYISSAGAGVLISSMQEAEDNGGKFLFVKPSTSVKELFELLGLTNIFQSFDNQSDAIAYITGR